MKVETKYLTLGDIDFPVGYCKDMSFTDFNKSFAGKLRKYDIKEAYKKLGGRKSRIKSRK